MPKPNGKLRLVGGYRRLNETTNCPVHPFNFVLDLMRQIDPAAQVYAKLDAVHGCFQVPLSEAVSKLCTFLLLDGRYHPNVAPMGFKGSGDEFSIRTDRAMAELIAKGWVAKIMDDMCLQAKTMKVLLDRLQVLFDICFASGITLSLDKLEVGDSVLFAGLVVSRDGLKPDHA